VDLAYGLVCFSCGMLAGWALWGRKWRSTIKEVWVTSMDESHTKILRIPLQPGQLVELAKHVGAGGPMTNTALTRPRSKSRPAIMTKTDLTHLRRELMKRDLVQLGQRGEMLATPLLREFLQEELNSPGMEWYGTIRKPQKWGGREGNQHARRYM
jgi:hypothetical protein